MTVNCNPQPALQVYGDPINHVSDFRYLGSIVASGSSDLLGVHSGSWNNFRRVYTYPLQQKLSCLILLVSLYYSMAVNRRHVLNTTVYSMTNTVPLIHLVRHRQLKFLGHILRMSKEEHARRYALYYISTIGKRRPGRPRTSYLNCVQRLLGDNEGAMQEQQIAALPQPMDDDDGR